MHGRHRFRFGVNISAARSRREFLDWARMAEDQGYSSIVVGDHFGERFAPIAALMAAADATRRVRVGSWVFCNDFRHPVVLAKEMATIDVLSEGRLELGIGAGWLATDYRWAGMVYDPPARRIERLDESIQVLRGLFAPGRFSFAGKHYAIADLDGTPKPLQPGGPPLLVGGGGRSILGLAGRRADIAGINIDLSSGAVTSGALASSARKAAARKVAWIREAAGDRFDEIELNLTLMHAVITRDRREAAEEIARQDQPAPTLTGSLATGGLDPELLLESPHFLLGSVEQVIDELQRTREELGISYLVFARGFPDGFEPVIARLTGT